MFARQRFGRGRTANWAGVKPGRAVSGVMTIVRLPDEVGVGITSSNVIEFVPRLRICAHDCDSGLTRIYPLPKP